MFALVEEAYDAQPVHGSRVPVPTKPGLGLTLNEEVISRYPCIHLELD